MHIWFAFVEQLFLKFLEELCISPSFEFLPILYRSMNPSKTSDRTVFELKGSVLTILVLHLKEVDANRLYPQLEKKIGQARSFFTNAPVLIDMSALDEERQRQLDVIFFATQLRSLGLVPVGVRGCADSLNARVLQAGLGLLPAVRAEKTVAAYENTSATDHDSPQEKQPATPSDSVKEVSPDVIGTKVITQPVRSGQQVFAPQGDLIILSSVNAGAEVLAAGNIHVYGALRGRALAGINGDAKARIFSLQCNPELIAIAGEYRVNESLDERLLNQSVVVLLKDGRLKFEKIGYFNPLA